MLRFAAIMVGAKDVIKLKYTGCSLNIVFFSFNFVIFLNSASPAAALVFYLPGVCVQTLTPRENRERPESGIF